MIIWSGHGYLVAVFVILAPLLVQLTSENITGDKQFYQQSPYTIPGALLLAATLIFVTDRLVFSGSSEHTLFFVPMKWWALIMAGIAVVTLGTNLTT